MSRNGRYSEEKFFYFNNKFKLILHVLTNLCQWLFKMSSCGSNASIEMPASSNGIANSALYHSSPHTTRCIKSFINCTSTRSNHWFCSQLDWDQVDSAATYLEVPIAVTTMPCISLSEWRQQMMHRLFGTTYRVKKITNGRILSKLIPWYRNVHNQITSDVWTS